MAAGTDFPELDPYAVLGLQPRASREQVERAYRFCLELYAEGSLATYSLLEPNEAEAQRARVKEAYHLLADPERRRAYDEGHGILPPLEPVVPLRAQAESGPAGPEKVTGPELRKYRESRNISLRQIANTSKVGVRILEYIEADRFAYLPAPVYLRGFLKEYAKALDLDPARISAAYIARLPQKS